MNSIILDIWNNSTNNFMQYATEAYTNTVVGQWFYPVLFLGIIGYVYAYMRSAVVAMIAIMITFSIFATTAFAASDEISTLLYIIVILIMGVLFVLLITQKRR